MFAVASIRWDRQRIQEGSGGGAARCARAPCCCHNAPESIRIPPRDAQDWPLGFGIFLRGEPAMQKALLIKAALVGAIFLVLQIPLRMIDGIVAERSGRQQ